MYGALRGLNPTLRQAQQEGRTWFYADNGHLKPGHFEGYFRVTRNAYQIDGRGVSDGIRFKRLGIRIAPWRPGGKHIVFCPPSETWCRLMGVDHARFVLDTICHIRHATDRPLLIRSKSIQRPLENDLANCWCLVTYTSNAAVDAAIAGVPVVCLGRCAATAISGTLDQIEAPSRPDRESWLGVLADHQWLLSEMRDGTCWAALNGQQQH